MTVYLTPKQQKIDYLQYNREVVKARQDDSKVAIVAFSTVIIGGLAFLLWLVVTASKLPTG